MRVGTGVVGAVGIRSCFGRPCEPAEAGCPRNTLVVADDVFQAAPDNVRPDRVVGNVVIDTAIKCGVFIPTKYLFFVS